MVKHMSYSAIAKVLDSWELSRQKYGCDEEVGTEILLNLFRLDPTSKAVFGFRANQNIESNPLLRMGVLVHAARIVQMLDCVISLLGPDTDTLEEILSQLGERHKKHGVKKEFFPLLIKAVCEALGDILGDQWNDDIQAAWEDLFGDMAQVIVDAM
jgi:hemoglobin-like flavoprotein